MEFDHTLEQGYKDGYADGIKNLPHKPKATKDPQSDYDREYTLGYTTAQTEILAKKVSASLNLP